MTKKLALIVLFISVVSFSWAAPIIVHHPPLDARANEPLVINCSVTDPSGLGIGLVTLFVRTKGTLGYWQQPMQARGSQYIGTIPAKLVLAAGLEYYIEVREKNGAITTAPAISASITPYKVNVIGGQSGPALELLSPDDGAQLNPEEVVLVIAIDSPKEPVDMSTLKFYFDEKDVTSQVNQTPNMLSYVAPEDLGPGLHGFRVEIKDKSGQPGKSPTWSVRVTQEKVVEQAEEKKKMQWRGKVTLASQYAGLMKAPTGAGSLYQPEGFLNRMTANLNGEVSDWRFIGSMDMSSEETPGQQPVNRFQFEVYRPELSITLGDIYPVFSEFSLENYFIRGGGLKLTSGQQQGVHSQLNVVGGISNFPIEGRAFEYPGETVYDSEGTFEQWLFGSRWDYEFLPGTGLSLNLTSINDFKNSIEEPAGATGEINHVLTGEGKFKVFFMPNFTTAFFGEYGLDYFDEEQTVTTISFGDAYRLGNRWEWQGNSFVQFEYRRVGSNYVALANPWLVSDWEGLTSDVQLNFMNNNLSLLGHVESWKDNLDDQKNLVSFDTLVDPQGITLNARGTKTLSVQGAVNYRIAPIVQNLFTQVSYNSQVDESTPIHMVNTDSMLITCGTGLLFALSDVNQLLSSLTYTLSQINNKADYRVFGDSQSSTVTLAAQLNISSSLLVSAGLGFVQTQENNDHVSITPILANRKINQNNVNLRADWKLTRYQLDVFGTFDLLGQSDDSDTLDETVMTLSVGGNYYLPYRQNVMLTLSSISADDHIDDALDYTEFIVDLSYGVGF